METGILTKMDTAHFTLVNLRVLTIKERQLELYYDIVTLKLIEDESQCQKILLCPSDGMYRTCP